MGISRARARSQIAVKTGTPRKIADMTGSVYTTDTSPEAQAVQLECLRKMSPHERIRQMCAMSRQVRNMAFEAIRRRHPGLDESEVQLLFIELTYGKPLADDVRRWKAERAG